MYVSKLFSSQKISKFAMLPMKWKKIIMAVQSCDKLQNIYIKHSHFYEIEIFENFTHVTYFRKNISKILLLEFENFNSKISCFTKKIKARI